MLIMAVVMLNSAQSKAHAIIRNAILRQRKRNELFAVALVQLLHKNCGHVLPWYRITLLFKILRMIHRTVIELQRRNVCTLKRRILVDFVLESQIVVELELILVLEHRLPGLKPQLFLFLFQLT